MGVGPAVPEARRYDYCDLYVGSVSTLGGCLPLALVSPAHHDVILSVLLPGWAFAPLTDVPRTVRGARARTQFNGTARF